MDHGYPQFVTVTFMDGNYQPVKRRPDMIPAMQHAVGILSYLKYDAWTRRRGTPKPWALGFARAQGDYLCREALTPDQGVYAQFPRSTGKVGNFPQPEDAGCQADRPHEIEPDKGGLAAYALVELYAATNEPTYLKIALRTARTLVATMKVGDAAQSPWPFRADYRTGEGRGDVSANMSFILRLWDRLRDLGYSEFAEPAKVLWTWIKQYQIPSAAKDGKLWVQFHEDYDLAGNRNSWSASNLARYILEKREALDPDWKEDAGILVRFVGDNFMSIRFGVPVCGEQDDDKDPWGGSLTNYAAMLALYSKAVDSRAYRSLARQAFNFALYAIDNDGCPGQTALRKTRGGWQEDAHTDVIHNFMDAIATYPEWGK